MSLRTPLVIVNGLVEQLQAGDTLSTPFVEQLQQTNGESTTALTLGMVVYNSSADTVKRAIASAAASSQVTGIWVSASTAAGVFGQLQTDGVVAGLTGLTAGSVYYLDPTTAGAMTVTAPSTVGQYVVRLGVAISTTEFGLNIQQPILL